MGKKRTVDDPFEDYYELGESYWDSKEAVEDACYDVYPKWRIQKAGEPKREAHGRMMYVRKPIAGLVCRSKFVSVRAGGRGKTRKST